MPPMPPPGTAGASASAAERGAEIDRARQCAGWSSARTGGAQTRSSSVHHAHRPDECDDGV